MQLHLSFAINDLLTYLLIDISTSFIHRSTMLFEVWRQNDDVSGSFCSWQSSVVGKTISHRRRLAASFTLSIEGAMIETCIGVWLAPQRRHLCYIPVQRLRHPYVFDDFSSMLTQSVLLESSCKALPRVTCPNSVL